MKTFSITRLPSYIAFCTIVLCAISCSATSTKPQPNKPPENPIWKDFSLNKSCTNQDHVRNTLNLINEYRAKGRQCGATYMPAVKPLTWNCQLELASVVHSYDMASNNFHSHQGSNGVGPGERITKTGYKWINFGENIAAGSNSIEAAMKGWINSEGHCANIMSDKFKEVAVAFIRNNDSDYRIYWTQTFGRAPSKGPHRNQYYVQ